MIALGKQHPICSRRRRLARRPRRLPRAPRRCSSGGTSCPRTCPARSGTLAMRSSTDCSRWRSRRRSEGASVLPDGQAFQAFPQVATGRSRALVDAWAGERRSRCLQGGVKPSRIARQFGLSQSDVRKALATDMMRRGVKRGGRMTSAGEPLVPRNSHKIATLCVLAAAGSSCALPTSSVLANTGRSPKQQNSRSRQQTGRQPTRKIVSPWRGTCIGNAEALSKQTKQVIPQEFTRVGS